MQISKKSLLTGVSHVREIDISPQQFRDFCNKKLGFVQDAFPHLNADDREFLISGITPDEWESAFPPQQ